MAFLEFLDFLEFMETSKVVGGWPQPTGDRYLLWGSVAYCLCQGTQDTTRTPSPSCFALAEWHICQPVISSKLKGDTALCSGKPEETTNSKSEGLARDLDSFFHTRRRQHHRARRARREPYLLACWLVLGCLLVSDEVRSLYLYEYVIGAERIGAALDCLLGSYDDLEPHTPSVLRRRLLALATVLRAEQPGVFTVTRACLLVVAPSASLCTLSRLSRCKRPPSTRRM